MWRGSRQLLPAIAQQKGAALNLDRVAPALNAIDRAVPGLGAARRAAEQQTLAAGLLALLGQPVEIEGKRGVSVPVRFNDGKRRSGRSRSGKCRRPSEYAWP